VAGFVLKGYPIKYTDPDGRDILKPTSTRIREALNILYIKSETFRKHYHNLLKSTNPNGQKLVVGFYVNNGIDYAGLTRVELGPSKGHFSTFTIDNTGNIIDGSINEGDIIHYVQIDINLERINRYEVDLLAVLAEEVAHASESADTDPQTWNRMVEEEAKISAHDDRPHEQSAGRIRDQILHEIDNYE
jgi:hypothetical protein